MNEQHQFSCLDSPLMGRILLIDTDLQDLSTYTDMLRSMAMKSSQARRMNEQALTCSKRILTS